MNNLTWKLWQEEGYPKLRDKVSWPALLALGRAYRTGFLIQPIEEESDESLLAVFGIGPKRLAEIREVIPAPA